MAIRKKHIAAPAGAGVALIHTFTCVGRERRSTVSAGAASLLAFAMSMVWSVLVVHLPAAGFDYSTNQLFWLAALPGLSGATLRLFYDFMVPIFGGRKWTALTTGALLLPSLGIGIAVQDPATGYPTMLALALLCGVGGANLAASGVRGLDAGLGGLGASLAQLVAPLAISAAVFGAPGGPAQVFLQGGTGTSSSQLWLQNAGFVWVPFIVLGALCAWFGISEPVLPRASFVEQSIIFRRKHNWIMCWLCAGALGSLLGYAAGFPLLLKTEFPAADPLAWAFLGPLASTLANLLVRSTAVSLVSAARLGFVAFCLMAGAALGVLYFLPQGGMSGSFTGFFAMSLLLFGAAGAASAAMARMIPLIFNDKGGKEGAAVLGFTSTLAAFGAFFIPKSYGTSIALTGSPEFALWCFVGFYASCIAITWCCYMRPQARTRV